MTIEEYLAELRRHLRVGPLAKRRILREVDAHLRDAAEENDEERVTARLGTPESIAAQFGQPVPKRRVVVIPAAALAVAGAAVALAITLGGTGGPQQQQQQQVQPPLRLLRTGVRAKATAGYGPSTASVTVRLVVADRRHRVLAHVTCSSDTRSGWVSPEDISASVEAKTILGVPSPNCRLTS